MRPIGQLARQPFQYFETAFERTQFAGGQTAQAAFEASVCGGRTGERGVTVIGQAKREAAAVGGIGLTLDQPGANQRVDRAADRRGTALHPGGNLVERRRLLRRDRLEQVAGLAHCLGCGSITAQLFDQPRESRCQGSG